jgi:cell division septation protein DedD
MLALVVAIVAGVASALWLADDSSSANETVVATTSAMSIRATTTTAPEPTATTTTTAPTTPTAPATTPKPPASTRAAALAAWPAGKRGWTIVLDSVPTANGRAPAVAEARQALHVGMKQVGVLDSGQFSSLHPGYFVVFAGIYGTEAEAQSHVIDAHRHGYPGPYPRPISP